MNYHAPPASAAALEALKSEISARSEEFQALRHIPKDIVAKFQAVGVYRAFVPKRFGGDELAPQDFCRLIEEISAADASAGWVASFGVSATYLAALPPETYAAIYGANPNTVFAGAMFPPQPARWPVAFRGCRRCQVGARSPLPPARRCRPAGGCCRAVRAATADRRWPMRWRGLSSTADRARSHPACGSCTSRRWVRPA